MGALEASTGKSGSHHPGERGCSPGYHTGREGRLETVGEVIGKMGLGESAIEAAARTEANVNTMLSGLESRVADIRRSIDAECEPELLAHKFDALSSEAAALGGHLVTEYRYRQKARAEMREGLRGSSR